MGELVIHLEFTVHETGTKQQTQKHKCCTSAWDGPALVQPKLSDTNYLVTTPGMQKDLTICHCNFMKPFVDGPDTIGKFLNESEEVSIPIPQMA